MAEKQTIENLEKQIRELKESNDLLYKILESNPHGIALVSKEGRYLKINPFFTKITGYTLDDIPDRKTWWKKAYPDPEYRKFVKETWAEDADEWEIDYYREFKVRCRDGSSKYLQIRTAFIKDNIIFVLTDVTESKQAREELKESEERLKAIFTASPDPLAVYNAQGHPLYLNSAFTAVFGWTLEEVKDGKIPFVPEDQKQLAQEQISKIYETGEPVRFETRRLSKQGEIIDVALSAAIIKDYKGMHNGLIVSLKDISERKRMERHIQQSQKMEAIGTLAGGIAHDFNNILFPILGNAEILMMDMDKASDDYTRLKRIYESATRAKELVKQILTFSRQEEKVHLSPVELQPIIRDAYDFIRSTIPSYIEINLDMEMETGLVKADSTNIHQIIINLATNALHAMKEEKGRIDISLKQVHLNGLDSEAPGMTPGDYICLKVEDNGQGMDEKILNQIFDPFYTTKEKGRGTGMGLSIVHGIIKKMDGFIKAESSPGMGTCFKVYMPVTD